MITASQLGNVFAHQYQCRDIDAPTLRAVARHIICDMEDDRDIATFVSVATMSGLDLGNIADIAPFLYERLNQSSSLGTRAGILARRGRDGRPWGPPAR